MQPIIAIVEKIAMRISRTGHIFSGSRNYFHARLKIFVGPSMSNIRRLFDRKDSGDSGDDEHPTDSFAGGHKSGLAVEYPGRKKKGLRIEMYANGFIVGEGPFRPLSDPANAQFLQDLRSGSVPEELRPMATASGGELPIELAQFEGDYDPSKAPRGFASHASVVPSTSQTDTPRPAIFSGTGSSLGGPNRNQVVATAASAESIPNPVVDPTKPSTSVQMRIPGGARVQRTFNECEKGAAILRILTSGLNIPEHSIVIASGFPPKPIDHSDLERLSLKELGLNNSAINVSFK
jgi:hypothetical protein